MWAEPAGRIGPGIQVGSSAWLAVGAGQLAGAQPGLPPELFHVLPPAGGVRVVRLPTEPAPRRTRRSSASFMTQAQRSYLSLLLNFMGQRNDKFTQIQKAETESIAVVAQSLELWPAY